MASLESPQGPSERLAGLAEKTVVQTAVTMDPRPKTIELFMPTGFIEIRGSRELHGNSLFDPELNNSTIFAEPHSSVCLLLATGLQNKEDIECQEKTPFSNRPYLYSQH